MKFKLANQKFNEAKKWMEDNYDGLSEEKKANAFERFQKVSDTYDEAWNNLSTDEREREIQRKQQRVSVLATTKSQNDEVPARNVGRSVGPDDNSTVPAWLQKHERCADRVQG
jgi:hypothetical protein